MYDHSKFFISHRHLTKGTEVRGGIYSTEVNASISHSILQIEAFLCFASDVRLSPSHAVTFCLCLQCSLAFQFMTNMERQSAK